MIDKQTKINKITIFTLFSIALMFIIKTLSYELVISYLLLTSETISDLVKNFVYTSNFDSIYIVSLVKSFSDVSINLSKFIQPLHFFHVIAPCFLILVYNLNRVFYFSKSLKRGIILYFVSIILKYLTLFSIALFVSPIVSNPGLLLSLIGYLLIINEAFTFISVLAMLYGMVDIIKKKEHLC